MDVNRLGTGAKVVGVSAIALLLIMFIFDWFGLKIEGGGGAFGISAEGARNAWGSYGFIDIVLFITVLVAIAFVAVAAGATDVNVPVALSAVVTGLGALSVLLIIISIISPPDFGVDVSGTGIEHTRKIGVWLGLLAAIGVTVGGWMAMQEEGTSFGDQADRLRGGGTTPPSGGTPPPPPPGGAGGTTPPPPSGPGTTTPPPSEPGTPPPPSGTSTPPPSRGGPAA